MKLKWTHVPLWVAILHWFLEQLDYKFFSPISSWLTTTRMNLIEENCWCDQCVQRHPERAEWRKTA